jgi:WD repeat-containing protein 68
MNVDSKQIKENNDNYCDNDNDNENLTEENLILNFESDKPVYSMSFQYNDFSKIALGSLDMSLDNQITILNIKDDRLIPVINEYHQFPISKLMWCPYTSNNGILGASSDYLRIYKYNEEENILEKKADLFNKKSKYSDPLTSFDWNRQNEALVGTASLDTTCTIWDLNKEAIRTQLIAHDKQVLDIAFSQDENTFISAGADGSIRLFDLRSLEHSTILYECKQGTPIIKLAWNKQNIDQISSISMNRSSVQIINISSTDKMKRELKSHCADVNAMAWAPHTSSHLCTVGEDGFAYIWDLLSLEENNGITQPYLQYHASEPIKNVCWSESNHKWIGITYRNTMRLLKL